MLGYRLKKPTEAYLRTQLLFVCALMIDVGVGADVATGNAMAGSAPPSDAAAANGASGIAPATGPSQGDGPGQFFQVSRQVSSFLRVIPRGDANLDGAVDITDMILVTRALVGGPEGDIVADWNGDGIVDVVDLAIVAANLGQELEGFMVLDPSKIGITTDAAGDVPADVISFVIWKTQDPIRQF